MALVTVGNVIVNEDDVLLIEGPPTLLIHVCSRGAPMSFEISDADWKTLRANFARSVNFGSTGTD